MLLRLGRVAYLCIFALVVVLWTGSYGKSREMVHKGWDMTTQAFGQGSSFAVDDMVALDLGSDAGVAHGIDEETAVEVCDFYNADSSFLVIWLIMAGTFSICIRLLCDTRHLCVFCSG